MAVLPAEIDSSTRVMEESASGGISWNFLVSFKHWFLAELFDGRTSSSSNFSFQLHAASVKDKDSRKKSEKLWSSSDDTLLKSLVERYSTNWPLVSECFNSSRLTTVTDRRTATDCFERWKERFGSERKAPMAEAAYSSEHASASTSSNQMTTRGVKRLASASISSPSTAFTSDARKRLRHGSLTDAVRRTAKKRADAAQKAQGRSIYFETDFIIFIYPQHSNGSLLLPSTKLTTNSLSFHDSRPLSSVDWKQRKTWRPPRILPWLERYKTNKSARISWWENKLSVLPQDFLCVYSEGISCQTVMLTVSLGRPTASVATAASGIANTNSSTSSATSNPTTRSSTAGTTTTAPGPATAPGSKPASRCRCHSPF